MRVLFLRMAFDTWTKAGSDAGRPVLPALLDNDPPTAQQEAGITLCDYGAPK